MQVEQPNEIIEVPSWNILIIDDDEDDYVLARQMLAEARGRKVSVDWAATFAAGREKILSPAPGQPHYHAVLVDYDLGLHSGLDLIREACSVNYPTPLILFTGRGNYEIDLEAMQAGASLYLTKSEVNSLLLERAIRYAIERKQSEEDLRRARDEARAAAQRLRESEARELARVAELNAVLQAVPAVVWVTHDPDCREVTGNQAAFDALRLPQGCNLSLSEPPDHQPRDFRVLQDGKELDVSELPLQFSAATGQSLVDFEEELTFDDGTSVFLLGNVAPLLDDEGRPAGAVAAFIDITARKRTEQELSQREAALQHYATQLERSNRDLQNFAFLASHDLQEPLRKITGFSALLRDRLTGQLDENSAVMLERIYAAGERMQAMVRRLLDLAQVQTHGQPFTRIDLNQTAAAAVAELEEQISSTGGQVILHPLPEIEGDPLQIYALLLNLVSNGLKFHKPGQPPLVEVAARETVEEEVTITVYDNGIGFDMQDFNRILEPFQRLHGTSQFQGSGIGLAICSRIIERHRGRFSAESEPGRGTTFIITLPRVQR
jgi:signal transduction histidine kinase/FixJ family two-component response regulator